MNHSKATAAKKCQPPTPWHKVRTSPCVCWGLWFTSKYSTETHSPSSMHLLESENNVFFSHHMGFALIKKNPTSWNTIRLHLLKSSPSHFKARYIYSPSCHEKAREQCVRRSDGKSLRKNNHVLFLWHRGCYLQPGNKIQAVWNSLISDMNYQQLINHRRNYLEWHTQK